MGERSVTANGIDIWTEDFGDPSHPTVLLIVGNGSQGIHWPDELCEALVKGRRHVIRYDNRDTGQSTCVDFAESPYTISDMARDAVGVLDAYGIGAAHLVGASMGGMIAQQAALDFPDRVLSLTSFMSTPASASAVAAVAGALAGARVDPALPGPTPAVLEQLAAQAASPPHTREARLEAQVELWRVLTGTLAPFDEGRRRRLEERALDRGGNPDATMNHTLAIAASPDRMDALSAVAAPTLVIHGTADPVLPYEHGVATTKAIPGSKLVAIEGLGHECPVAAIDEIAGLILEHTR